MTGLVLQHIDDVRIRFLPDLNFFGFPGHLVVHAMDSSVEHPWTEGADRQMFDTTSDDHTSLVSHEGIQLGTEIIAADPVPPVPADPSPEPVTDNTVPVPEPGIPDPIATQNAGSFTSQDGLPVEIPGAVVEAGTGNTADAVKGANGLITSPASGAARTSEFAVQGLFKKPALMNERYGSSLMTLGSATDQPSTDLSDDPNLPVTLVLPGTVPESKPAEQKQADPEAETTAGQDDAPVNKKEVARQPETKIKQPDQAGREINRGDFSQQLQTPPGTTHDEFRKLEGALAVLAHKI